MHYNFSNLTILDVNRIVSVKLHPGSSMQMVNRETEGLIIALNGELNYHFSNSDFVSDSGHVLLLSRGINYSFESITDSISVVINFSTASPLPFSGIISLEADLKNMATRLDNTWSFKKRSYRLKCIEELYSFFINNNSDDDSYIPSQIAAQITPSIKYMEQHYTDSDLSNDELAKLSCVSTVYFRKIFTKCYGMSPMKYVRHKRIEKAKSLLESEIVSSIEDVAESCGFNSLYYFSNAFKQETSCSPSSYRMLYKNKEHVSF